MQDTKCTHIVQMPEISNVWLCPVIALKTLLASRQLQPTSPLFANKFFPHSQIIDTYVRDALKTILTSLRSSHIGYGFHSFRRSRAISQCPLTEHRGPRPLEKSSSMDLSAKFHPGLISHSLHLWCRYLVLFLMGLVP